VYPFLGLGSDILPDSELRREKSRLPAPGRGAILEGNNLSRTISHRVELPTPLVGEQVATPQEVPRRTRTQSLVVIDEQRHGISNDHMKGVEGVEETEHVNDTLENQRDLDLVTFQHQDSEFRVIELPPSYESL